MFGEIKHLSVLKIDPTSWKFGGGRKLFTSQMIIISDTDIFRRDTLSLSHYVYSVVTLGKQYDNFLLRLLKIMSLI